MSGVSETEIKKFITKHGGQDMQKDFLGIYAADELKNIIDFRRRLSGKKHSVLFCIVNTDPIELPGQHWISVLNICPENHVFTFDSFGELGYSTFIKSDDEEIINNFLVEEGDDDPESYMDNFSNSLSYKSIRFKAREYSKSVNADVKKQLTPACRGLLQLFTEYAKSTQNEEIICHFLNDQIQETESSWCGIFAIYFLYNLFNPIISRRSSKNSRCTMKHIKMTLEELFNPGTSVRDRQLNTITMQVFVKDYNIKGDF